MPTRTAQPLSRRLGATAAAVILGATLLGMPAAHATPGDPRAPQATSTQAQRAAVMTMTVWQSGTDIVAQGTLTTPDRKPLANQRVAVLIDNTEKGTATTDNSGAWQGTAPLGQTPPGLHTVAARFDGTGGAGSAQIQAQLTTTKPQQAAVLSATLTPGAAGPGEEVKVSGELKSGDQAVAGARVTFQFAVNGAESNLATTDSAGHFELVAAVPKDAPDGPGLSGKLDFAGDTDHSPVSMQLPLFVQRTASPSPTVSPSATPSATPSAAPTAPTATGVITPGVSRLSIAPSAAPAKVGLSTLLPFILVGVVAVGAACGLGYWLWAHRDDPDAE